jgi:uncharacterized protein
MTRQPAASLGLGIGWRPEIALAIERIADLGFVEFVVENMPAGGDLPPAVEHLRRRGVAVIPHGISLSLGGADRPDRRRLEHLRRLALLAGSPMVSEHIAFVRAGGVEAGHLLPLPRTRAALDVLVENVTIAMDVLQMPLALENISALFEWPDSEMDESEFIAEALDRTGAMLLLDLSNVHANARNLGLEPEAFLDSLPLEKLAYVHIGGGYESDGTYHDTHAHPVPPRALELLGRLSARAKIPGAMLERDDNFPREAELHAECAAIRAAMTGAAAVKKQPA